MLKHYKIADLTVAMDSFGKTEERAREYQIRYSQESQADIFITSNRRILMKKYPNLDEDSCEYLSTGSSFYRQLIDYKGMLIHASAVVMDGKAYLFSAPCGTGKSTHTQIWCRVFGGERAYILNDDKPAVRLETGEFYAYGTPWSGKSDLNINMRVPLAGICMIRRGNENRIKAFGGSDAVYAILEQTVRSSDGVFMNKLLDLLKQLFDKVPVWQMECNMEPDAAVVSYTAMSQGWESHKSIQEIV